MTRSVNTSVTTLLSILVLYILGVDSIKQFALPIIVGIVVGTYSSVNDRRTYVAHIKRRQ